jgi:hypothetical protein
LIIFSEEHRLRIFDKRVLRKILGPKRDEMRGKWRRLHERGLLAKCYSGDQIKKNGMGGACSTYGREKIQDRILVGRAEGRRSHTKPRRRWEDNIKVDLQEIGWRHELD